MAFPPQNKSAVPQNERLSRVKELSVTTALQLLAFEIQTRAVTDRQIDDPLKEFFAIYREVYDELTYPEDASRRD